MRPLTVRWVGNGSSGDHCWSSMAAARTRGQRGFVLRPPPATAPAEQRAVHKRISPLRPLANGLVLEFVALRIFALERLVFSCLCPLPCASFLNNICSCPGGTSKPGQAPLRIGVSKFNTGNRHVTHVHVQSCEFSRLLNIYRFSVYSVYDKQEKIA